MLQPEHHCKKHHSLHSVLSYQFHYSLCLMEYHLALKVHDIDKLMAAIYFFAQDVMITGPLIHMEHLQQDFLPSAQVLLTPLFQVTNHAIDSRHSLSPPPKLPMRKHLFPTEHLNQ